MCFTHLISATSNNAKESHDLELYFNNPMALCFTSDPTNGMSRTDGPKL